MVDKNKTRWLSVRSTRERRRLMEGFKPYYRRLLPPGVRVTGTLVLEQLIDAGAAALLAQGVEWVEPPAEVIDGPDDEEEGTPEAPVPSGDPSKGGPA